MTQYSFALTRPRPEVLLGDVASPLRPADSGADQCPLTTSETITFSLTPATSLHLPPPRPSDQLENDKEKLFYLNIKPDTEKTGGVKRTAQFVESLRFQLFASHVILMGKKKKSVCISNVELG